MSEGGTGLEVRLITPAGDTVTVAAADGQSVMSAAVTNGVRGIVAECGGSCACATCHVYVDDAYTELVGPPGPLEADMLEGAASEPTSASRLSCQIRMRAELDGLLVRIAPEQL